MEKSQYRGYIQIRTFLGDDATKIFNDLRAFAGDALEGQLLKLHLKISNELKPL